METTHITYFKNSQDLSDIENESVDLVVTSPPYPMIEMWDELFFKINPEIKECFSKKAFLDAFCLMHQELNKVWEQSARVLTNGGILCINIGDATRTLDNDFQLWSNHTYINHHCISNLKLKALPMIIWRKPTNKPSKFMGSGMLPPNAYVTLEHEYILVFKKGEKREFKEDTARRYDSAFFWEERNEWFSDVWFDIRGTKQKLNSDNQSLRDRSAAYPLDLAIRLINMFSVSQDTVLDPFWGTGTTSLAAMLCGRNSIGYELCPDFYSVFKEYLDSVKKHSRKINQQRLQKHFEFVQKRTEPPKHKNENYNFGVITAQESKIKFYEITDTTECGNNTVKVNYEIFRQSDVSSQVDAFSEADFII